LKQDTKPDFRNAKKEENFQKIIVRQIVEWVVGGGKQQQQKQQQRAVWRRVT
jgi:hypothetical protein